MTRHDPGFAEEVASSWVSAESEYSRMAAITVLHEVNSKDLQSALDQLQDDPSACVRKRMAELKRTVSKELRVTFGTPEEGWLEIEVAVWGSVRTLEVSDLGPCISLLVESLVKLASGSTETQEIHWPNEPGYWLWEFAIDGDVLEFSVTEPLGDPWLAVRVGRKPALRMFCRSLLKLGSQSCWSEDDTAWSWEFPYAELARLQALVDA